MSPTGAWQGRDAFASPGAVAPIDDVYNLALQGAAYSEFNVTCPSTLVWKILRLPRSGYQNPHPSRAYLPCMFRPRILVEPLEDSDGSTGTNGSVQHSVRELITSAVCLSGHESYSSSTICCLVPIFRLLVRTPDLLPTIAMSSTSRRPGAQTEGGAGYIECPDCAQFWLALFPLIRHA